MEQIEHRGWTPRGRRDAGQSLVDRHPELDARSLSRLGVDCDGPAQRLAGGADSGHPCAAARFPVEAAHDGGHRFDVTPMSAPVQMCRAQLSCGGGGWHSPAAFSTRAGCSSLTPSRLLHVRAEQVLRTATPMSTPISPIALDHILAVQLTVAWAGESRWSPVRRRQKVRTTHTCSGGASVSVAMCPHRRNFKPRRRYGC